MMTGTALPSMVTLVDHIDARMMYVEISVQQRLAAQPDLVVSVSITLRF